MRAKSANRKSRALALALRHRPDTLGLTLDAQGWASVDAVLAGLRITEDELHALVEGNDKQRFALSDDGTRIRASQGHSQGVVEDLGLVPTTPPERLFHGTAVGTVPAIQSQGILRMGRDHVHLSSTTSQAAKVGMRHGSPVVLVVSSLRMHGEGHRFLLSANGVWLVEHVPSKFIVW